MSTELLQEVSKCLQDPKMASLKRDLLYLRDLERRIPRCPDEPSIIDIIWKIKYNYQHYGICPRTLTSIRMLDKTLYDLQL